MKAATQEQREALARLPFSRDGKLIMQYIEDAIVDVHARMDASDDLHRVRKFQGESHALHELKKLLTPVSS